jgi:hypothetical protein
VVSSRFTTTTIQDAIDLGHEEATGVLKFESVDYRSYVLSTYDETVDEAGQTWYRERWSARPEISITPASPPETAEVFRSLARSLTQIEIGVLWRLDEKGRPDLMQVQSPGVSSAGEPRGADFVSLGRFTCIEMPGPATYPYLPPD